MTGAGNRIVFILERSVRKFDTSYTQEQIENHVFHASFKKNETFKRLFGFVKMEIIKTSLLQQKAMLLMIIITINFLKQMEIFISRYELAITNL